MSTPLVTATASLAGKYLTVVLDSEASGLNVLKIREIIRLPKITPVAQMPPFVKGVVNNRGRVIPVVGVKEVVNHTERDIEPTPDFGANADTAYLPGMAKVKDQAKTLLAIDRVVGAETLQSVLSAA